MGREAGGGGGGGVSRAVERRGDGVGEVVGGEGVGRAGRRAVSGHPFQPRPVFNNTSSAPSLAGHGRRLIDPQQPICRRRKRRITCRAPYLFTSLPLYLSVLRHRRWKGGKERRKKKDLV